MQEPPWRVYKGWLFSWVDQICQKRNCESFNTFYNLIEFKAPIVATILIYLVSFGVKNLLLRAAAMTNISFVPEKDKKIHFQRRMDLRKKRLTGAELKKFVKKANKKRADKDKRRAKKENANKKKADMKKVNKKKANKKRANKKKRQES